MNTEEKKEGRGGVWRDKFHAVSIEKKLRSTTSSWNNLRVWTSSSWLRSQDQQLHKWMEELPQQPLVAQEAAADGTRSVAWGVGSTAIVAVGLAQELAAG